MNHRHHLVAIRNVVRVTFFIGLILSIIFFLKSPKDSIIPSNFYLPEQIFNKKCQYIRYPTMELLPEVLHAEELTSNLIKLLVFPQYNITTSNCRISEFGSTAYSRTIYMDTEPNSFAKSPLINNLLSESALVAIVVIRYHQVFSTAVSSLALPPYDVIFQECLNTYRNCEKLEDAVFQMFLIYKRHMAEYTHLRYLKYTKRLNRNDILPAANTSNVASMNSINNQNNVREATQASGSTTTTNSTSLNKNVVESDSLQRELGANESEAIDINNKEGGYEDVDYGASQYSSNDNDVEDFSKCNSEDGNGDTADPIAIPPPSDSPEGFEFFLSSRLDSFADTKKPSKIPLPSVHDKIKKASSLDHNSLRRNLYLQSYIDNQQLEAIPEAEEESEQEPEPVQEESLSELDDDDQADDIQYNDEQLKEIGQDNHAEEKHIQQYYTQYNNTSNFQQPSLPDIQHNWPLQVNATVNPQQCTANALSSPNLHSSGLLTDTVPPHQTSNEYQSYSSSSIHVKDAPYKANDTTSRSTSGCCGGISQVSSSSSRHTHQKHALSNEPDNSENISEEETRQIYYAMKISLAEARNNSLTGLGDSLKHHEINLLDPNYYYNPGDTDNIYEGPKEIAEKLGLQYTGSSIVVVCQEPLECEICRTIQ